MSAFADNADAFLAWLGHATAATIRLAEGIGQQTGPAHEGPTPALGRCGVRFMTIDQLGAYATIATLAVLLIGGAVAFVKRGR